MWGILSKSLLNIFCYCILDNSLKYSFRKRIDWKINKAEKLWHSYEMWGKGIFDLLKIQLLSRKWNINYKCFHVLNVLMGCICSKQLHLLTAVLLSLLKKRTTPKPKEHKTVFTIISGNFIFLLSLNHDVYASFSIAFSLRLSFLFSCLHLNLGRYCSTTTSCLECFKAAWSWKVSVSSSLNWEFSPLAQMPL